MSNKDKIFQTIQRVEDFTFDEQVAAVFDDMIARSVPYYEQIQQMQSDLVQDFLPQESGLVCDLGCSTGSSIELIFNSPRCPETVKFIGYDNSQAMLAKAHKKLAEGVNNKRIALVNADLSDFPELPPCHVVLLNWTLQFVRPMDRENLLNNIFTSLHAGGALFLSEKILGSSSQLNRIFIEHYLQFKTNQRGYTDIENKRKREALENVLIPYRLDENYKLLNRSGFKQIDTYFRWLNFVCIIAVKGFPDYV